LIAEIMAGYNTTVFAYGQTGSGKTHTMMGDPDGEDMRGIIPRLVEGVFDAIGDAEEGIEFTVKISYVEIYNEQIRDLLDVSKSNLRIRDGAAGSVYIQDVTEVYVGDVDGVLEQMEVRLACKSIDAHTTHTCMHAPHILTRRRHRSPHFSAVWRTGPCRRRR
jgi:kinesin family protein 5